MRGIIIDTKPSLHKKSLQIRTDFPSIDIIGEFDSAENAYSFLKTTDVDVVFIAVEISEMNRFIWVEEIQKRDPEILAVFLTSDGKYIGTINQKNGRCFILKSCTRDNLLSLMRRENRLSVEKRKQLYVQMFGKFIVFKDGKPIPISGIPKAILALVITERGKEISNEQIYTTLWGQIPQIDPEISIYYHSVFKLKKILRANKISDILISTSNGHMVDTFLFECDYYSWLDRKIDPRDRFYERFLEEYPWGKLILDNILPDQEDE